MSISSANNHLCTAGFITRSREDDKPYLLTAGHCIRDAGLGTT